MQIPEAVIQATVMALSASSGHVIASLLNLGGVALLVHRHLSGKHLLDSLELWKLLPQAKKYTYYRLALFGLAFAFTMFRCATWIW
jgi:hypothetical protein